MNHLHRIGIEISNREEISNETSPRKKRKIEPENNYVSDDDRVPVMASDEFEEAEEEAQPQEDHASRVFNPELFKHCKICRQGGS